MTSEETSSSKTVKLLSNGTHDFQPTVILVSLDGFRQDYLERDKTPALVDVAEGGLIATLKPVFPTLTFPNHWSILTGLYPAYSGIIANDFHAVNPSAEFNYHDASSSWKPEWWLGEPIWETAERAGIKSLVMQFPSPPETMRGISPTYYFPYTKKTWQWKSDHFAQFIDLPFDQRPQLMLFYLPDIDQEGHRSGPDGSKLTKTLSVADSFSYRLMETIRERNLTEIVDVIFIGDHGMTETSDERIIYLDEILGEEGFNGINFRDGWPNAFLTFQESINSTLMYEKLLEASNTIHEGHFNVFIPETLPDKLQFFHKDRTGKVMMLPELGWTILSREELESKGGHLTRQGDHGYDNEHPDMQSIFLCSHGPLARRIKSKFVKRQEDGPTALPTFSNLELYNLIVRLLDIDNPAPNNGTEGFWDQYL
ncbi:Phosphodiest-domain-containing protein [Atractiella rhizophila]|nr:Phosphodiest-domain-containing protein [Atractiella rhizophila]